MHDVRPLQKGVAPLVLLGALVLMGMGSLEAWAPSSSAAPSGPPDVYQTHHLQSDAPAPSGLQSRADHFPIAAEILTSRETESDDTDEPPHPSPSSTSHSFAPQRTHLFPHLRGLYRRPCVLLCVFLC